MPGSLLAVVAWHLKSFAIEYLVTINTALLFLVSNETPMYRYHFLSPPHPIQSGTQGFGSVILALKGHNGYSPTATPPLYLVHFLLVLATFEVLKLHG